MPTCFPEVSRILRRAMISGCLAAAVVAGSVGDAIGGTIVIAGDTGDGGVDVNGVAVNLSDPDFRPGTGGDIIRGQAAIYFFALPDLSGSTITAARLQIQYLGIYIDSVPSIPEFDLDLFGIGARPSPIIQSSDYFAGDAGLSPDTLIQSAIITPSTVVGNISIANSNLLNFLSSLYHPDGTPVSAFAAFRVNPDVPLPPNDPPRRGYLVATADNPDASFRPELDITTAPVPEPIAIAVGSLLPAIFGISRVRRRTERATKRQTAPSVGSVARPATGG